MDPNAPDTLDEESPEELAKLEARLLWAFRTMGPDHQGIVLEIVDEQLATQRQADRARRH